MKQFLNKEGVSKLWSKVKSFVNDSIKTGLTDKLGKANGIATLDTDSKLTASQLPSLKTINGNSVVGTGNITIDLNIYSIVETLPTLFEANPNKIYLVLSKTSGEQNLYTEYAKINGAWEKLGEYKADIDLTPYVKKDQLDNLVDAAGYIKESEVEEKGYQTAQDVETSLNDFKEETDNKLTYKANIEDLSNVLGEEVIDNDTYEEFDKFTREEVKKDLFIDLWNEACGKWGTYNKETGYFELNGLTDITYEEALKIYTLTLDSSNYHFNQLSIYSTTFPRTNLPRRCVNDGNGDSLAVWSYYCYNNDSIEVLNVNSLAKSSYNERLAPTKSDTNIIVKCQNLKKIVGTISLYGYYNNVKITSLIKNCPNLESVHLYNICTGQTLYLNDMPLLYFESFSYLVNNRFGSSNTTVIVHPNIYNALIGEAEYPFNGGTREEWIKLNEDAIARQITFATA